MDIGRINDYNSIWQNYKVPSITEIRPYDEKLEDVKIDNSQVDSKVNAVDSSQNVSRSPKSNAPLEDISLTFNAKDDFGYIGKDSDIYTLDMEKAISDMKKDNLLQQYQYFVGGTNLVNPSADGNVVIKLK